MSIWHPETAEDSMAWVPIIGCFLPLAIVVCIAVTVIISWVG